MPSQILMFANSAGTAQTNAAAAFVPIHTGISAFFATEATLQFEAPQAGVIKGLYVRVLANDSSVNQVVTLRKNTADTTSTVTITPAATGVFQMVTDESIAVAVGDLLAIGITSGAGTGSVTYSIISTIYTITAPDISVQMSIHRAGSVSSAGPATVSFSPVFTNMLMTGQTAVTSAAFLQRTAASYTYFRVYISANAGATAQTAALYVDAADTALLVNITAATSGEFLNTATTVSVAALSSISYRLDNSMNTLTTINYSLLQMQRNSKWSNIGAGSSGNAFASVGAGTTRFWPLGGMGTTATTTESQTQVQARGRFQFQNMQINIPANAGGTTVALRVNGVDTMTQAISCGTVGIILNSTSATPSVIATDLLNWAIQQSQTVLGGMSIAGITVEMASIDSTPFRTLMGVGI